MHKLYRYVFPAAALAVLFANVAFAHGVQPMSSAVASQVTGAMVDCGTLAGAGLGTAALIGAGVLGPVAWIGVGIGAIGFAALC
jgi:hypothetical protein